jgi:hypothetical protein
MAVEFVRAMLTISTGSDTRYEDSLTNNTIFDCLPHGLDDTDTFMTKDGTWFDGCYRTSEDM